MGIDSYEHAQQAWDQYPPFEMPVFMLTHKQRRPDIRKGTTFYFTTPGFKNALNQAKAAGAKMLGHLNGRIRQAAD